MKHGDSPSDEPPPTQSEKRALRTLVRGIVLAQGNIFIKELLRDKGIKIGATKADFESNLLEAIDEGKLRRSDIDRWLDEVEGWGDQHVYLFHVPKNVASDSVWSSSASVLKRLTTAGLADLWNAQASLEYPDRRKLTGVYFDEISLRFVWHQGLSSWLRTPDRDFDREIDGDLYQFRAHRARAQRSVMRFELRLSSALAAVFMQIPWSRAAHQQAMNEVREATGPLLDLDSLSQFSTSAAIKKLDQAELSEAQSRKKRVTTQRTRLSDAGVYVEFASTSEGRGYKESEPVRQVRRALRPEKFSGTTGVFLYQAPGPRGLDREVKIELFGDEGRIRLWVQLTAQGVWEILHLLKSYG